MSKVIITKGWYKNQTGIVISETEDTYEILLDNYDQVVKASKKAVKEI